MLEYRKIRIFKFYFLAVQDSDSGYHHPSAEAGVRKY
jgi:hypothetical protein